jgi:ABC-2 type transport system ATP-binding protein
VVRGVAATIGSFDLGPVTLSARQGELLCLLGPNGAGKTTLLRTVLGLLPCTGQLLIGGRDVRDRAPETVRSIGYVPDDPDELIPELSASELWELHAYAHSGVAGDAGEMMDHAFALAEWFGFEPPAAILGSYSHGMRKKTQLVAALLHGPSLLIVDEPRNGLDPFGIDRVERYLRYLATQGTAILLASHDLHWAQRVADRVAVLDRGQVLAFGPPGALVAPEDRDLSDTFFSLVGRR